MKLHKQAPQGFEAFRLPVRAVSISERAAQLYRNEAPQLSFVRSPRCARPQRPVLRRTVGSSVVRPRRTTHPCARR